MSLGNRPYRHIKDLIIIKFSLCYSCYAGDQNWFLQILWIPLLSSSSCTTQMNRWKIMICSWKYKKTEIAKVGFAHGYCIAVTANKKGARVSAEAHKPTENAPLNPAGQCHFSP